MHELVLRNALTVLVGRYASLALSLVSFTLLTRYLGAERMGQYGVVYAYLSLFAWIASFGLEQILPRQAALRGEEAGRLFGVGTSLGLLLSAAAVCLALLVFPVLGYASPSWLLVAIAAPEVLVLAALRLPGFYFQVAQKQWYSEGIVLARQLLWLIVLGLVMLRGGGLVALLLGRALCAAVEAALILYSVSRFVRLEWGLRKDPSLELLGMSWPIALSSLCVSLYRRVDQVILGLFVPMASVGHYVAAVNVVEQFSIVPIALMNPMLPVLSRAAEETALFARYRDVCFRYLLIVGIAVAVGGSLGGAPVPRLLFGESFRESGPLLAILIWSEVAVFFEVVMTILLIASKQERLLPVATLVGALANVSLNLLLVPRLGPVGAAWATVASYSLSGALVFVALAPARETALSGLRELMRALPPALLVVAALTAAALPELLEGVLGVLLYAAALLLLGVLKASDLARLLGLLRRPSAIPL
jgi:PST family polysaccharide transporter